MTSPYTLHLPADYAPSDPAALDRAVLVRDGFSWGAFLVPMLWFFSHRHWLAGLAALVVVVGLAAGLWALGVPVSEIVLAEIALHLLLGFEGSSIRRLDLAFRGRPAEDVVLAADLSDAEQKSFARWLEPEDDGGPPLSASATGTPFRWRDEPVIGLFPDLEGRRP